MTKKDYAELWQNALDCYIDFECIAHKDEKEGNFYGADWNRTEMDKALDKLVEKYPCKRIADFVVRSALQYGYQHFQECCDLRGK